MSDWGRGQVIKVKAKASGRWGQSQGQTSSRPRPKPRLLFSSRHQGGTVLDDPIPVVYHH